MSDKYIGHGISDETKSLAPGFYEYDENIIVTLKLKSLKSIFVKIEVSMNSCSHHHSSGLKSFKKFKSVIPKRVDLSLFGF